MKCPIDSVRAAEAFGRTRLSYSFFMRDFLHSEIATMEGMSNLPDDPELAIAAGRGLCQNLLEPLQDTFGRLHIRSSYRSPEVNAFGCKNRLSCASNETTSRDISGTAETRAESVRSPASSCPGSLTGGPRALPGKQWHGGSMTTFPTASYSSFRSWRHSTSAGMKRRSARSIVSFRRGASSPSLALRTTPATTANCTEGFLRLDPQTKESMHDHARL